MSYNVQLFVIGTFLVVAAFLVLTNPKGDQTVLSGLGQDYVSGVKALQGR